jgi:hypothetical protein
MTKFKSVVAGVFILFLTLKTHAQTGAGADYFAGKWNVVIKGTPQGDARMFFVLEKKDSTMTGVVQDSTGTQISKLDKVELAANSATLYFNVQGYDVNLVMNKKDDDHVTGSLMGMFDADGERVKGAK